MLRRFLLGILLTLSMSCFVGCGGKATIVNPVSVKGTVAHNGSNLKNVVLSLHPLDKHGKFVGLVVGPDGAFSGEVVPGNYAYFISAHEPSSPAEKQLCTAAFKSVPAPCREVDEKRSVKISKAEDNLQVTLN